MGRHNPTRVDEGRKVPTYSRDKNEGTYRSGERGEEDPLFDPGPESLLTGREIEGSARIIHGMKNTNKTA